MPHRLFFLIVLIHQLTWTDVATEAYAYYLVIWLNSIMLWDFKFAQPASTHHEHYEAFMFCPIFFWIPLICIENSLQGHLGGSAVECLPSGQGVIPRSWNWVPHRAPHRGACFSLCLCLCLSLCLSWINKIKSIFNCSNCIVKLFGSPIPRSHLSVYSSINIV